MVGAAAERCFREERVRLAMLTGTKRKRKCSNGDTGKILAFLSPGGSKSWRAYRFMWFRKQLGFVACPVVALALMFPVVSYAQQQLPQSNSQEQYEQFSKQSTKERAQVLLEAQRRLEARREQRTLQIISQTYNYKYEIFAGGGYLRFRPGPVLQHNQEAEWNLGLTDYLGSSSWGITGEIRGYYGNAFTNTHQINQAYEPTIAQYVYLGGPTYRFFRGQHWGWTAQVLGGMGQGKFSPNLNGLPPQLVGLYKDETVPYVDIGASVDYNLSTGLAIRLTPEYLLSTYGGQLQGNKGWQIDIVYRMHHRRHYHMFTKNR